MPGNADLIFRGGADGSGNDLNEYMRITGTGNVGIGTTSPLSKLDVRSIGSDFPFTFGDANGFASLSAGSNFIAIRNENNNEAIRVSQAANGRVSIGTSSFTHQLRVDGTTFFNGLCNIRNGGEFSNDPNNTTPLIKTFLTTVFGAATRYHMRSEIFFEFSGNPPKFVFQILDNGNVQNENNSYGAISDIRKKENITPAKSQIEDFKKYNFVNYNLKTQPDNKHLGLIAQEVLDVSPSLVHYNEEDDLYSVNYSILYLKACKCIQELIVENEELKNKYDNLIEKVEQLEKKINS
jgi:hypothetical protein